MLNKKSIVKGLLIALPLAWAVGCSSTKKHNAAPTSPVVADTKVGTGGAGAFGGVEARDRELMQTTVFYFDFDKSDIKPEYTDALAAHGRYLAKNPNARIRVEGHTDERGSREYNIGLGERRAQSVEQVLVYNGANSAQIAIVSYGTERPAVQGHDEHAWSKNRRAIIVYEGGH